MIDTKLALHLSTFYMTTHSPITELCVPTNVTDLQYFEKSTYICKYVRFIFN